MPTIRTTNTRRRRQEGHSFIVLDSYEREGATIRELLIVQNGRAQRHTPKLGMPGHFEAMEDGELIWRDGGEPAKA